MEENILAAEVVSTEEVDVIEQDVATDGPIIESEFVTDTEPDSEVESEGPRTDDALIDEKDLGRLLKQVRTLVEFMQNQWDNTRKEFSLTDDHMRALYDYNLKHRALAGEGVDPDDPEQYDRFNGLDAIDEASVVDIFGEDHPIIGVEHTVTIDRIKIVINDFFGWMGSLKEYNNIYEAYTDMLEYNEDLQIKQLSEHIETEEDAEKKAKMVENLDNYYSIKYLDFLKDPLSDDMVERLAKAFSDASKIEYWIGKCRERLKQIQVSPKFILEISQLEKRFLDEKYHNQNNIFLLYFMNLVNYSDLHSTRDTSKSKILCIVVALDRLIKGKWDDEVKDRILSNLNAFEDQFINKLQVKENTSPNP